MTEGLRGASVPDPENIDPDQYRAPRGRDSWMIMRPRRRQKMMRNQDRSGWMRLRTAVAGAALVFACGAIYAQNSPRIVPKLTGNASPMTDEPVPPFPKPVTDDKRRMRNYPGQPPVIPHSIDNYQLTLKTNRCLDCHRREYTEGSSAPMISVTHFMDRNGEVLADVTPSRYFCTACYVIQYGTQPLVPNTFRDMAGPGH